MSSDETTHNFIVDFLNNGFITEISVHGKLLVSYALFEEKCLLICKRIENSYENLI